MTKREYIIHYFAIRGLNISPYINDYAHQRSGTIILNIRGMRDYNECYEDWLRLQNILNLPNCPISAHKVQEHTYEHRNSLLRLILNN